MLPRLAQLPANPNKRALVRAAWRSLRPESRPAISLEASLEAVYRWLCRAQDATATGGVARWYDLVSGRFDAAYPETTGYIIPSFLAYAEARGVPEARERALRMADWEAELQMEDGAVLSGVATTTRGPAVFNTGQVLFGWIAAHVESGDGRYAQAARRAADWLVDRQDADGAWRRNLSVLTDASVCTYNNRCAWALAYAGTILGDTRYVDAGRRNSDWTIAQQNDVGWFAHTGFSDGEIPLLHTISYVIEGLLGVHAFTADDRYLEAARKAADAVVGHYRASGTLAGRYDERWRPTASWRCVTGDAQIAVVLHRLERWYPGAGYREIARRLVEDVARMQLGSGVDGSDPSQGGVPGSFPVWGEYCSLTAPNWAAKFFLDALLLELHGVDEKSFPVERVG
jgi:hypothetical protein